MQDTSKSRCEKLLALPRLCAGSLRYWWSGVLFPAPDTAPEGSDKSGSWIALAVLALIAGGLLFLNLNYPLLEPDEGRYAEVVREMRVSGQWLWPTINNTPFYDKPPLFYWLVGVSFELFGTTVWAARLVPALAAFLTVLAIFILGRRSLDTRTAL